MLASISKVAVVLLLASYEAEAFVLPVTSRRLGNESTVSRRRCYSSRRRPTTLHYLRGPEADTQRDFYAILGVPRTASEDHIKQAYRKLAKLYHPGECV